MNTNRIIFLFTAVCWLMACEPYEDEDLNIGQSPPPPSMQVTAVPGDGNRYVLSCEETQYFSLLWDCAGATPPTSTASNDTVVYARAGEYNITLHASTQGGNGSSSSSTTISVAEDLPLLCDGDVAVLTGDCGTKCWTLSPLAGSVQVGSGPLESDFFSSTGIDFTQMNDRFCFDFNASTFAFEDGGETFSACSGYVPIAYDHPQDATYFLAPAGGAAVDGPVIELSDGSWLAVEDSGPNYEIVSATENEMILSSEINPCPGGGPGYFTLTLVPAQ